MSNVMVALPAGRSLSKDNRELASSMLEIMAVMRVKSLESKKKQLRYRSVLKQEISKLQNVSDSLLSLDDPDTAEEIIKQNQTLLNLTRDIDQSAKEISILQLKVKEAEKELEVIRQQQTNLENKLYPRARYAVNLLREVGKVTWQMGQSSPLEVKGFIRGKSCVKAFCFDVQKQSHFFITNSLWEMGEEEVW
ncbi:unnamed protein product [Candidula unifasciata]|uniref:Kinetochore protein Spc24 n=1 Tax=Candidula unifasciata TaxID=100452 RepID=A0A8S3YRQ8_9EUPU|nr:unnamed protein product [Candidula unifasciata]